MQLSDKCCKNSMSGSPSQSAFPRNLSTTHSDAVYSCAVKGESSSAILRFMLHQVECYTYSLLFNLVCCCCCCFCSATQTIWMQLEWMDKMITSWFSVNNLFYVHFFTLHADHKANERSIKRRTQTRDRPAWTLTLVFESAKSSIRS